MRRKNFLIIITVMAAACLVGACGKSADESLLQIQIQPDESGQEEEASKGETDKEASNKEASNKEAFNQGASNVNEGEKSQVDDTAQKLTAQQEMAMDDYSIESYEAVQKFGYELLAQNIQDKNPVLSPVSAYLALAMAGCGADGTTKEEFYKVLGGEGEDMITLSYDMIDTLPAKGRRKCCIPVKSNAKTKISHDQSIYKKRHRIENMFARIKDMKGLALRTCRCAHTFTSMVSAALIILFF